MALLRKLRRNLADLIDPESDRQHDPAPAANSTRAEITKKLLGEEALALSELRQVEVQADGAVTFSKVPGFEELVALTMSSVASEPEAPPMPALQSPRVSNPLAGLSYGYRPSWDPGRGII